MDPEQDMEDINIMKHQEKDCNLAIDETDSQMKITDECFDVNKLNSTGALLENHTSAVIVTGNVETVESDVIPLNTLGTSGKSDTNVELNQSNTSTIGVVLDKFDGNVDIRPTESVKMDTNLNIKPPNLKIEQQSMQMDEDVKISPIKLEIKGDIDRNAEDVCKVDNCVALVKYEIDSSDDSSSSSDDVVSCSSSDVEVDIKKEKNPVAVSKCQDEKIPPPPRTATEKTLEELPQVEEPIPKLPDDVKISEVGFVSSIIGQLVVIQSNPNNPALNLDTLLFKEDRQYVGKIFEVFGPVICPLYAIRFNSTEHIKSTGVDLKMKVFYALDSPEFTSFVLMEQLRKMKGSDASWKNDEEPPVEFLDYSDDEKEVEAKGKLKGNRRKRSQRSFQNNAVEGNVTHQSQQSTHRSFQSQQHQQDTQPRKAWNRFVRPPQAQVQNCWPVACPAQFQGPCQGSVSTFSPGRPMFPPNCGPPRFENQVMHPHFLPCPPPTQQRLPLSPPPSGVPMHSFPPQHFLMPRPLLNNPHLLINPFQVGLLPPPPPPPPTSSPPPLPPAPPVNFGNLTMHQIPPFQ